MQPYCRNNSNFTFREICCKPPPSPCNENKKHCCCDACNNHNFPCNCGNFFDVHNKNDCNCNNSHKPPPKPSNNCMPHCFNPFCNQPYFCVPIKSAPNGCNPFTYVMIGYMLKNCDKSNFYGFNNNFEQHSCDF